jgi:hypothetical protein
MIIKSIKFINTKAAIVPNVNPAIVSRSDFEGTISGINSFATAPSIKPE